MFFSFTQPPTPEIYTLSLHDALPIFEGSGEALRAGFQHTRPMRVEPARFHKFQEHGLRERSEEHTSELQSRENLVCRLLLEKKKVQPLHTGHAPTAIHRCTRTPL